MSLCSAMRVAILAINELRGGRSWLGVGVGSFALGLILVLSCEYNRTYAVLLDVGNQFF